MSRSDVAMDPFIFLLKIIGQSILFISIWRIDYSNQQCLESEAKVGEASVQEAKGLIKSKLNCLDSRFNNRKVLDVDGAQKVLLHITIEQYKNVSAAAW